MGAPPLLGRAPGPAVTHHDERRRSESTGSRGWPTGRGVLPRHHPPARPLCRGVSFSTWRRRRRSSRINDREVAVSNPQKVYFPRTGHTKLDLVRYYLAVADGALRGVGRSADGAQAVRGRRGGRAVLPEAGSGQPSRLDPDRGADVPVRPDRRRDRPRRRGRARLGRQPRLHRPQPAPGAGRRPRPPRRAARRPRPGPGRALVADPRGRARDARGARRTSGSSAGRRPRARAASTSTSGSSVAGHIPEVRRAALALARDVERRAPGAATSKWWKEERHGVFLDYNQNAKDRTVASAYSVRPLPDARVSTPLTWDEVPTVEAEAFTLDTVPARYADDRRPGGRDRRGRRVARRAPRAVAAARDRGLGRRPVAAELREAGRRAATRPAVAQAHGPTRTTSAAGARRAVRRRRSRPSGRRPWRPGDPNAGLPTEWAGSRPTPTGRRKTNDPGHRDRPGGDQGGGAGRPWRRWKERHPAVAAALEPADVLVDGMRGRSYVWYRVRVNLIHVPEADRPPQGPLEVDYDPWAGYEWPDRSGQPVRSRRRPSGEPGA